MSGGSGEARGEVRIYLIGYAAALLLTGAAFGAVHWHIAGPRATFAAVLLLGLVQAMVQFRCFLHVSLARTARDDLQLVLFSALIIALMVGGTLVVLFNLHGRMM